MADVTLCAASAESGYLSERAARRGEAGAVRGQAGNRLSIPRGQGTTARAGGAAGAIWGGLLCTRPRTGQFLAFPIFRGCTSAAKTAAKTSAFKQ